MRNSFKFKKEFYGIIAGLTDKQAGEFIKGVCGYVFENKPLTTKDEYLKGLYLYAKRELDVSALNSANGRKGAEKLAENKQKEKALKNVGVLLGSVLVSASGAKKDEERE